MLCLNLIMATEPGAISPISSFACLRQIRNNWVVRMHMIVYASSNAVRKWKKRTGWSFVQFIRVLNFFSSHFKSIHDEARSCSSPFRSAWEIQSSTSSLYKYVPTKVLHAFRVALRLFHDHPDQLFFLPPPFAFAWRSKYKYFGILNRVCRCLILRTKRSRKLKRLIFVKFC